MLKIPAEIRIPLNIADVDVMKTEITEEGKFIISVESRKETTKCGVCGQRIKCNYGQGAEITMRHLPILEYETYIRIKPKRGQCQDCPYQPTTTQQLEWYEQRSPHTKVYDRHLLKQLVGSTIADVSVKEKVGYDAVLGALGRHIDQEVNWENIERIDSLGIDEISSSKGRKNYFAIVTARGDDGEINILGVLRDRKKKRWQISSKASQRG